MAVKKKRLCDVKCGETVKIVSFTEVSDKSRRIRELGFSPESSVTCVMQSPLGDPTAYLVRGSLIALRREHSEKILVEVI